MSHLSVPWRGCMGPLLGLLTPVLSSYILRLFLKSRKTKNMSSYHYEPGAIHIDHHKDMSIEVKSAEDALRLMRSFMADGDIAEVQPEPTTTAQRGRKTQFLFADIRGNEDTYRAQLEIERVRKYVAEHRMGQYQLDSKATSKLNLMVACFWYRWNELEWVGDEPQGAAIYRFFTTQCGLECGVLPKAFSTKIVEIINSGKKDPEIYDNLYSYFPELNKNNKN